MGHPPLTKLLTMEDCSGKKVLIVKMSQNDPPPPKGRVKKVGNFPLRGDLKIEKTFPTFIYLSVGLPMSLRFFVTLF